MLKIRTAILGASGYTGADAMRLAAAHPQIEITALTANAHAGQPVGEVFPHLAHVPLPALTTVEDVDWSALDAVICGLPHATTQEIAKRVLAAHPAIRFIDMSADFRLRDPATFEAWYGKPHAATDLQAEAVYGLTEHYRDAIAKARIVACPGCYPTAVLLALLPPLGAGTIAGDDIIVDAKSGVTGAGRGLKQGSLFAEVGEGLAPYGVAGHRHAPEIEQELSVPAGREVVVNFTPHLIPMSRGELCTCYVRLEAGSTADDVHAALAEAYAAAPFVHVLAAGTMPKTQNVRGSNHVEIGVAADRIAGRAIVVSALDNLVKGSAGQALQNLNVAFGIEETTGLTQLALFP